MFSFFKKQPKSDAFSFRLKRDYPKGTVIKVNDGAICDVLVPEELTTPPAKAKKSKRAVGGKNGSAAKKLFIERVSHRSGDYELLTLTMHITPRKKFVLEFLDDCRWHGARELAKEYIKEFPDASPVAAMACAYDLYSEACLIDRRGRKGHQEYRINQIGINALLDANQRPSVVTVPKYEWKKVKK